MTARPSVSIVVPTFCEADNLEEVIRRVESACSGAFQALELIFVDDNSPDQTAQVVAGCDRPWVRLEVRRDERGLSSAVLHGMRLARHDLIVVMDADLSHPPEAIPKLADELLGGGDFAVGSRYMKGGSTDAAWGVFRSVNSRVATLLARPFTKMTDPMSGFFAMRRSKFVQTKGLNPIGYKIGLELIVKGRCRAVREVPIHFADRARGESKLNVREQLRYLRHIGRLARFRLFAL